MRPKEGEGDDEPGLFEAWMGKTPAQWEALGCDPDPDDTPGDRDG